MRLLVDRVNSLERAVNEGNEEKEELKQFKKEVNEYERFVQLLEITRTKVSDMTYPEGVTCYGYLIDNKIPLERECWVTLTRRCAAFYRMLHGKDPNKNVANQNIYCGKDVAFILAT
jgi:hypothetical protein